MELTQWLRGFGLMKDGDSILDVGCGYGRLAISLAGRPVRYLGIEPDLDSLAFCKRAFEHWPHIQFQHMDLRHHFFNPDGAIDPLAYSFPLDEATADCVIFNSVFTHIEQIELCHRYLSESWRVLKPGGKCWTSWFRSPPNDVQSDYKRAVFREAEIIQLVKPFQVLHTHGGLSTARHDQWVLLLQKTDG